MTLPASHYLAAAATALTLIVAAPALAQPMNHSGTNIPDATDKERNIARGLPPGTQQPDTRDSVRKKARHSVRVRHHRRHRY
jgi:hypothetical protein